MEINDLKIEFDSNGAAVTVWVTCLTQDDIADVIAWLQLAKIAMAEWGRINAKAPALSESVRRAFGASDAACYHWPDGTDEHKALRMAYCQGAADYGGPSGDYATDRAGV